MRKGWYTTDYYKASFDKAGAGKPGEASNDEECPNILTPGVRTLLAELPRLDFRAIWEQREHLAWGNLR